MTPTPCRWIATAIVACAALLHITAAGAQTPEQEKLWEAQRAQAQAEAKVRAEQLALQREARKSDPMAWVRTLNPMSAGGWQFRAVAPDGSWAAFSTEHQMKHSGHLITVWVRQEYPEPQRNGNDIYFSNVEKIQYDCANDRGRALLIIYYAENNIAGSQQSEAADPKQAPWVPIVPGTQSEYIYQWACDAGSGKSHP
jgi:hypothetical protein